MDDERPDGAMMIGLHKLAEQFGDGLVPELYELLTSRARSIEASANVTEFPVSHARAPGMVSGCDGRDGYAGSAKSNILAFQNPQRADRRLKDRG